MEELILDEEIALVGENTLEEFWEQMATQKKENVQHQFQQSVFCGECNFGGKTEEEITEHMNNQHAEKVKHLESELRHEQDQNQQKEQEQ